MPFAYTSDQFHSRLLNHLKFNYRIQVLMNAAKYIDRDGLNTLRCKVKGKQLFNLYTQIEVNVEMTEDEKALTSLKVKN